MVGPLRWSGATVEGEEESKGSKNECGRKVLRECVVNHYLKIAQSTYIRVKRN